jgi:hypothetical protein
MSCGVKVRLHFVQLAVISSYSLLEDEREQ